MANRGGHGYTVIFLTFVAAYVLAVVPLPLWLQWARPEWVALTLIYWCIALPQRVGIVTGLAVGVGLDVLEGAALGQNAFALMVVALLALTLYQRLRVSRLWQQAAVVFMLICINQLICQWVQNFEGVSVLPVLFLVPALSSALLWPVILHGLRGIRRYYRVT
ncbi:MAG: rod shape-determining protein MreD [Halioglobus sp.]|nr:rod shape-determining protein MreD [Halioglobus sp.]